MWVRLQQIGELSRGRSQNGQETIRPYLQMEHFHLFRQGMLHGLMAISHIGQLCIIKKELHKAESGLLVQFVLLLLQILVMLQFEL